MAHKRSLVKQEEYKRKRHGIKQDICSDGDLISNSFAESRIIATLGKMSVQQGNFCKWNYGVNYLNNNLPCGYKNLGTDTLEGLFNPKTKTVVTKIDTVRARKSFGYFISTNRISKKELEGKRNEGNSVQEFSPSDNGDVSELQERDRKAA